jgi:hypothetical protein
MRRHGTLAATAVAFVLALTASGNGSAGAKSACKPAPAAPPKVAPRPMDA